MALIGLLFAGVIALIIHSDTRALDAQGIRLGSMSPTIWAVASFLALIIFGPLYLILRLCNHQAGGWAEPRRSMASVLPATSPLLRFASRCPDLGS